MEITTLLQEDHVVRSHCDHYADEFAVQIDISKVNNILKAFLFQRTEPVFLSDLNTIKCLFSMLYPWYEIIETYAHFHDLSIKRNLKFDFESEYVWKYLFMIHK